MTGRAASETLKKRREREQLDKKVDEAVAAYLAQQELPENERKGARRIAAEFGVCSYRTILERAHGAPSISQFNASKQKISGAQENVLVDFLVQSAARGFGRTHPQVYEEATALYAANGGDADTEPLGSNWVDRFIERHHEKLQTHWTKPLDMQRANALNPATDMIFAMDEAGFPQSDGSRQRVVGARGTKTQHASGSGDRENVTAVVTICADGTALRPTIIYKGKK